MNLFHRISYTQSPEIFSMLFPVMIRDRDANRFLLYVLALLLSVRYRSPSVLVLKRLLQVIELSDTSTADFPCSLSRRSVCTYESSASQPTKSSLYPRNPLGVPRFVDMMTSEI